MVTACKDDICHFCKDREWVERRTKFTSQLLGGLGIEPGRLRTHFVSSQNGKEILDLAFTMVEDLKNLQTIT
jgi:coenzyme F420-reducing hydrogenase delta subunit